MLMNSSAGDNKTLVMRSKTKDGFKRETRFWAERGIVQCEDNIDGYSSMSVRAFLKRVNALNEMMGNSSPGRDKGPDSDLRQETLRVVELASEIARMAQVQGMPSDPTARRDMARRRKKTVCLTQSKGV